MSIVLKDTEIPGKMHFCDLWCFIVELPPSPIPHPSHQHVDSSNRPLTASGKVPPLLVTCFNILSFSHPQQSDRCQIWQITRYLHIHSFACSFKDTANNSRILKSIVCSRWWFWVSFHLLVLVHCVLSSQKTPPSTRF